MSQGNRQGDNHLAVGNHAAGEGNRAAAVGNRQVRAGNPRVQAGNLAAEGIPEAGIPAGEDIPAAAGTRGHQMGTHDRQQHLASGWT